MQSEHISPVLSILAFAPIFLVGVSLLREFVKVVKFPYTVALLIAGFAAQFVVRAFHLPVHLVLSPEAIFFIVLPTLLFEATIHLNIHQFKLQFRTISFVATFGLLLSMFITAAGVSYFVGLPFGVALLFGALISATDPIAVLALFKTLGAPKRLALLADGESMFNDATAVIAFRLISSFVVLEASDFQTIHIFHGFSEFIYIFFGSIIFGFILGYITSLALAYIRNDKLSETTLSMVLAYGSFYFSEHLFGLSGVIACVIAGITFGNLGKTKISEGTMPFIEEFWEYIGFLALSLVFFFAAFNLDFGIFENNLIRILGVILSVIIARTISVYLSFYISNRASFFKEEPNVPVSWQHIINWGGLRGVIPLVLVFSLPDHFEYKADLMAFTMGTFLFTLFANGLTIESLLLKLGLHLPKKEEELVKEESDIFDLEDVRRKLSEIKMEKEFDSKIIKNLDTQILKDEQNHKERLNKIALDTDIEKSIRIESLHIERHKLSELYNQGFIPESVYFTIEAQLDLQEDALEYPEVYSGRAYTGGGYLNSERSFRLRLAKFRDFAKNFPIISKLLGVDEKLVAQNRFALLKARRVTTFEVYKYLNKVDELFDKKVMKEAIGNVRVLYRKFEKLNVREIMDLQKKYPEIVKNYQEKALKSVVTRELTLMHSSKHNPAHILSDV